MTDWYTLHITFPADTVDEAVRVRDGLRLILSAQTALTLTLEEDWDALEAIGDRP